MLFYVYYIFYVYSCNDSCSTLKDFFTLIAIAESLQGSKLRDKQNKMVATLWWRRGKIYVLFIDEISFSSHVLLSLIDMIQQPYS